jgi:hypothetical protein
LIHAQERDVAVEAAGGQSSVLQDRQRHDRIAGRDDLRLARTILGPDLDFAILAGRG